MTSIQNRYFHGFSILSRFLCAEEENCVGEIMNGEFQIEATDE